MCSLAHIDILGELAFKHVFLQVLTFHLFVFGWKKSIFETKYEVPLVFLQYLGILCHPANA